MKLQKMRFVWSYNNNQYVVNAGAKTGKGCVINTFADVEHDSEIGDFCRISTGTIVNGE